MVNWTRWKSETSVYTERVNIQPRVGKDICNTYIQNIQRMQQMIKKNRQSVENWVRDITKEDIRMAFEKALNLISHSDAK